MYHLLTFTSIISHRCFCRQEGTLNVTVQEAEKADKDKITKVFSSESILELPGKQNTKKNTKNTTRSPDDKVSMCEAVSRKEQCLFKFWLKADNGKNSCLSFVRGK